MTEEAISPESKPAAKIKSTNRVLLVFALLAAGWTLYGTTVNLNRFRGLSLVLQEAKVPLPGIALLALEQRVVCDFMVVVIAGTCVFLTARDPDRRRTILANTAGIIAPLLWWIAQTTAFYNTTAVILEMSFQGLRSGR